MCLISNKIEIVRRILKFDMNDMNKTHTMLPESTKNRQKGVIYCTTKEDLALWTGTSLRHICKHQKFKVRCIECGGRDICSHGKLKSRCLECGGSEICKHKKRKSRCLECGGGEFCQHNMRRSRCLECCGGDLCRHGKRKTRCNECGGSETCKSSWCEARKHTKYQGFCYICFVNNPLFKDHEIVRNYKNKERSVVDFIMEIKECNQLSWVHDKPIEGGCSKRRPDLLLDMGSHIIIVEVDENQHNKYDTACEDVRNMNLWEDVRCRQIVFIRFNPDKYTINGAAIPSCWKMNKRGLCVINELHKKTWSARLDVLRQRILYWISTVPTEMMTTEYLFYDE